jgi:4-diphosphocytidyl-2-C-methyl-D-erythritol kinase
MLIQAPAKLNRFLAILGRFPDGFHEMELVTTVLDGVPELTDTLEGEAAAELTLELAGPGSEGLSADEGNLVLRAWRLLEREAGRPLPARLRLDKRIPHGAGLGGGSSDAAAALRLGNELFGLGLSQATLLVLGAALGSDVPLFLVGGTVLGLGRGERVFPLRPLPLEPILLVHPGLYVGTPSVFKSIAQVGYPFPQPCPSLAGGELPPWRNDLTGAAIWVCPALAEVRMELLESGGEPLLCGSGSCWAARYPDPGSRDGARKALAERHPEWRFWSAGDQNIYS